MTRPLFHGDDVICSKPEEALFHIIPVPLEQSVSYEGGTAGGSTAILEASCQLELLENGIIPAEQGIFTAHEIQCDTSIENVLQKISKATAQTLECNAIPFLLGGEHTVSLGAIQELNRKYQGNFAVVQFDAHADLRDSYTGTKFSHACVMRRVHELGIPIYQLGTRSYSQEESDYRQKKNIWYKDSESIWKEGARSIQLPACCPENIYLTFDVDAWDTSLMPATGTPVPGGLDWYQSIWLIESILKQRKLIGADFVELAPITGMHGYDFAVAQFIYRVMSYIA